MFKTTKIGVVDSLKISLIALLFLCLEHTQSIDVKEGNKSMKEITWILEEHLGEDWNSERISYHCELPAELVNLPLAIRQDDGIVLAAQFVPEQPKSHKGYVHFVVNLPAYVRRYWTLIRVPEDSKADIFVNFIDDSIAELGTSGLAVRVPIGQWEDSTGRKPEEVPTPIMAFKSVGPEWVWNSADTLPISSDGLQRQNYATWPSFC